MRELAVCVQNDNKQINPYQTIDAIKKAGFKNVFIQWYDKKWDISQEEQLNYINENNLNIVFAHLGYTDLNVIWEPGKAGDLLVKKYIKNLDECKKNNIPMVVMHVVGKKNAPMYNSLGLNRFKTICEYAKKIKMKIAFENTKIRGYLEYVLENINDDHVGLCFDSGHWHTHYNDQFDFAKYKNRIFAVHLHDNDQSKDQHLIPFDGTIDWNLIIQKLKECNYSGPITLELCYRYEYLNKTPEEFYKKGYEVGNLISEIFEKNN